MKATQPTIQFRALNLFVLFVLFVANALGQQPKTVTKSGSVATANEITEDLKFPAPRTLTLNGTLSGTPTGGALDLSNLTLTLPESQPLTGEPTASTAPVGTESTQLATTAHVRAAANYLAEGFSTVDQTFQYIDHRGNLLVYPEHTMEAYRASVSAGAKYIEIDVQRLADGGLGVMHDTTVDRTTTSSGNVNSFSSAAWANLVVDAGSFLGASWGNLRAPFFRDVLREFGGKVPLHIEIKSIGDGCGAAVLAELQRARISKDSVIINSFSASELTQFVSDGWTTGFYYGTYTGSPTPAALAAGGYDWVGVSSATSTAQMDALRAVGLKVAVYTVNAFYVATPLLDHCDAMFSDDAIYLRETARRTTDPFASQTWYHGHQRLNSNGDGGGRGLFTASDYWGYDMDAADTWVGALQGWASPMNGVHSEDGVTKLNSVVIDFSVQFVAAFSATRYAWISIGVSDLPYANDLVPPSTNSGYIFIVRKNGTLDIIRNAAGVVTLIGTLAGTTITDGATATYKVTITAGTVKLERTDVAGSVTVSDASYRGAYLQAGVKGIHGLFKDFVITFP